MTKESSKPGRSATHQIKYKVAGQSVTSSIDNTVRKEIRVTLPLYTQTFDITAILDVPHLRSEVWGQPYRVYSSDDRVIAEGIMSEVSGTVRTKSSMPVRCEIGDGNWSVSQESYNNEDIEQLIENNNIPL